MGSRYSLCLPCVSLIKGEGGHMFLPPCGRYFSTSLYPGPPFSSPQPPTLPSYCPSRSLHLKHGLPLLLLPSSFPPPSVLLELWMCAFLGRRSSFILSTCPLHPNLHYPSHQTLLYAQPLPQIIHLPPLLQLASLICSNTCSICCCFSDRLLFRGLTSMWCDACTQW